VMRGNLDYFMQRKAADAEAAVGSQEANAED
jgi:hypothetical protein